MNTNYVPTKTVKGWLGALSALIAGILGFIAGPVQAQDLEILVIDDYGNALTDFRWLVQEDRTANIVPGVRVSADQMPSTSFYKSYHPPVAQGDASATAGSNVAAGLDDLTNYFVSVVPNAGYSMSGTKVNPGDLQVTVHVVKHPIPTAQIAVFVFEDNSPVNGAPDLPVEDNNPAVKEFDPRGDFTLVLEDAGGRYGASAGVAIKDAFDNPLGTVHDRSCDREGQNPGTGPFGCLDADGNPIVLVLGNGELHPDETGWLLIKNLVPAKYGIQMIPPAGSKWIQTSTIEGTHVIDAWVKPNEPPFFAEFGPAGPHVFIGFVDRAIHDVTVLTGGVTVTGTITDNHMSRPPLGTFYSGRPFPGCRVALHSAPAGALSQAIHTGACDADSNFAIPDVPAGAYSLTVWDDNLDMVIASMAFTVDPDLNCNAGATPGCAFGNVPVFNWFHRMIQSVFYDTNENGFPDANEPGLLEQGTNIRWRDGTIYQSFPTDLTGEAPYDEVFPFFNWLVAEVDFLRFKATGVTVVPDAGGEVLADQGWDWPSWDESAPLPWVCTAAQSSNPDDPDFGCTVGDPIINPNTGNNLSWTQTGPVLTLGFQGFLGQTNHILWGKKLYGPGENGGITGIVYATTTRAENDPRFAAAEVWEPGIPRAQLNLYADGDVDRIPYGDLSGAGACPAGTATAGPEDLDWNANGCIDLDDGVVDDINGVAGIQAPTVDANGNVTDFGDALQVAFTDSWDDSIPTGCQGTVFTVFPGDPTFEQALDCYDGLRNFNQIRPGVFDGGFAFDSYNDPQTQQIVDGLPAGNYIVESLDPTGYVEIGEADKNVDFGDSFIPSPQLLPPSCVGDMYTVQDVMAYQTDAAGNPLPGLDPGTYPAGDPETDWGDLVQAPFAGELRARCNMKQVVLNNGQNAGVEFFKKTISDVPLAAKIKGMILNDLANEFDPNAPTFGEKQAPSWLPVAVYDWQGTEITRVYTDEFGQYNLLVPSTVTGNINMPSGISPNMLTACMNDAGPIHNPFYDPVALIEDPPGSGNLVDNPNYNPNEVIIDPWFNPQYTQFCYTFNYMPGATTFLDTPVLPVGAFAGPGQYPLDCNERSRTPLISRVINTGVSAIGAPQPRYSGGPYGRPGDRMSVFSGGLQQVPNPQYDGTNDLRVERDYRFGGTAGKLYLGGVEIPVYRWLGNRIYFDIPAGTPPGSYQLTVERFDNGRQSPYGLTVTVDDASYSQYWQNPGGSKLVEVSPPVNPLDTPIQDAIDAAFPGDLILVSPGTYDELVVMSKPVALQGWGAQTTVLNARKGVVAEKLIDWRVTLANLLNDGLVDPAPGQELGALPLAGEGELIFTEEGPGISVWAQAVGPNAFSAAQPGRIDGLTVTGADVGGGIFANAYVNHLTVSNNVVLSNTGTFGGGIRSGNAILTQQVTQPDGTILLVNSNAQNGNMTIHHNWVTTNSILDANGAGGGIALYEGTDDYAVTDNHLCGNFAAASGAAIGHLGNNGNSLIARNTIIFNESFNQGTTESGGGIFVGGKLDPNGGLTEGAGNVTITENLIQANNAGAGDGGGISLDGVNGLDVANNLGDPGQWFKVSIYNNMIVNNVTGLGGGGVALKDSVNVDLSYNTVANNDSTATAGLAFTPGSPNASTAQPAGIVAYAHSAGLGAALVGQGGSNETFSNPTMHSNIVWHNRSFHWEIVPNTPPGQPQVFGLFPNVAIDPPVYDDFGAPAGTPLSIANSIITQADTDVITGAGVLTGSDPDFVDEYVNGSRDQTIVMPEFTTTPATAAAFDEGGNFIQVAYGPLTRIDLSLPAPPNSTTGESDSYFDYHINGTSPAVDLGQTTAVATDFDGDTRPQGASSDAGADEAQ